MKARLLAWALERREGPKVIVAWADDRQRSLAMLADSLRVARAWHELADVERDRAIMARVRGVNWLRWNRWDWVVELLGGTPDFPGRGLNL